VEPDLLKLKYRNALIEVIGGIVRQRKRPGKGEILELAGPLVERPDLPRFIAMVTDEFGRLDDGNIARYKIRLSDYHAWLNATK
jgi:hypothetical protein